LPIEVTFTLTFTLHVDLTWVVIVAVLSSRSFRKTVKAIERIIRL